MGPVGGALLLAELALVGGAGALEELARALRAVHHHIDVQVDAHHGDQHQEEGQREAQVEMLPRQEATTHHLAFEHCQLNRLHFLPLVLRLGTPRYILRINDEQPRVSIKPKLGLPWFGLLYLASLVEELVKDDLDMDDLDMEDLDMDRRL